MILTVASQSMNQWAYIVLKIPKFTRGKSQLEQKLVDETREIAAVRIHVDRVIGFLRNEFTILQGILPIKMIMKKMIGHVNLLIF